MNLVAFRQVIPVMLLGLLFNNPSAKAQTRATSPNLEPSMERPGESTRTLPFARRSMLDRLTSPALRNISDVTSVSTRPGGMAKSTAETSETFVVFDESYLNGIALQENTSENPEPEPDDWQTFEIILFDRNESGRLDRVTYNYQEEPGLLEKDISDLTYDELGRLSRVTVTYEETYEGNLTTSEVFESYEYEYDESGRLSKYTENYLLGDEEEEESPETVVYEFVYGESSVEASIVSSLSVTDTLRVTYTEGQNLTYVITYPDEGTYRTTHYGIPDVETYLKMIDTSYFIDAVAVLEEFYVDEIEEFIPYFRIRHEILDGQVNVINEEFDFEESESWISYFYIAVDLDESGNPESALLVFQEDDFTFQISRDLFNPDPELLQFTSVEAGPAGVPTVFELAQNYPNPFNPSTEIAFTLNQPGAVSLRVFDALGREVAVLIDAPLASGRHSVTFDATGLPSGVYYYRLTQAGSAAAGLTRSMVLLK